RAVGREAQQGRLWEAQATRHRAAQIDEPAGEERAVGEDPHHIGARRSLLAPDAHGSDGRSGRIEDRHPGESEIPADEGIAREAREVVDAPELARTLAPAADGVDERPVAAEDLQPGAAAVGDHGPAVREAVRPRDPEERQLLRDIDAADGPLRRLAEAPLGHL